MSNIAYLASAEEGLRWFFSYYTRVFPEGGDRAASSLDVTEQLLLRQPYAGRPASKSGLRERRVSDTPFNLIYRVMEDGIEVVRVKDTRSE